MWSILVQHVKRKSQPDIGTQTRPIANTMRKKKLLNSGDNSDDNSVHAILELDRVSEESRIRGSTVWGSRVSIYGFRI